MKKLILLVSTIILINTAFAQCTGAFSSPNGVNVGGTPPSATSCNFTNVGGISPYEAVSFPVVNGATYEVRVNNVNWNEQVSIFNQGTSGYVSGEYDGGGGVNHFWTSNFTGTARAVVTQHNCNTTSPYGYFVGMQSATLSYRAVSGNPNDFGNGTWNVYGYNGRDWNLGGGVTYFGNYTETLLTYDSRNRWAEGSTPSAASVYSGCGIPIDNHTVVSKRTGFTAQRYSIDVTNHDDEAKLFINGTEVWSHNGCCDSHDCVWLGDLGPTSTVEFRHGDGGGGSHQGLRFNELGTSTEFGVNEWKVAVHGNTSLSNFIGSYTNSTQNFDMAVHGMGATGNPDDISNYIGCDLGSTDNWAVSARRQGFTCGVYQIYRVSHDDGLRVFVDADNDGTFEYDSGNFGCCINNTPMLLYTTTLDVNSRVVLDLVENTGDAFFRVDFTDITSSLAGGTVNYSGGTTYCRSDAIGTFGSPNNGSGGTVGANNGTPIAYEWYFDGLAQSNNSATFSPAAAIFPAPGSYSIYRSITDRCGSTANSNTLTINVSDALGLSAQSPTLIRSCLNEVASLSVTGTGGASGGTPINYQWQSASAVGGPYSNVGVTTNSYTYPTATAGTIFYQCVLIDPNTACSSISSGPHEVRVRSAGSNAQLGNGAITAIEQCTEGDWTYYASAANPDAYVFAINKNGSSYTATVTLTDESGTTTHSSVGGVGPARGTFLIGRTWDVSVTGTVSTSQSVRFFVDPAEVTQAQNEATALLSSAIPGSTVTPLTFFKKASGTFNAGSDFDSGNFNFTPITLGHTSGTLNGATYYELSGISSFSGGTGGFSVNEDASALPVELISFEAEAIDNTFIQVTWSTATEINNAGFELLRSQDGSNFEAIDWIEGNGNSTEIIDYMYDDNEVVQGTYYYQLKQVDNNGDSEYFDVVSAKIDRTENLFVGEVVPNPTASNFSIKLQTAKEELIKVNVFNYLGQTIDSQLKSIGVGNSSLDLNAINYPAGSYYIILELDNKVVTRKFVVSK